MTDQEAFLAAIHDAPDDDAPRLIFADWLDEHGESDRAEFIRIQVEMRRERETHNRITPRLDELFLRQKQLFQCAWADAARRCGAGAISTYSRGFPDFLQMTAKTFVDSAGNLRLFIGPNTRIYLRECHGVMHEVANSPTIAVVKRLQIGWAGWSDEAAHTDDDIAAFFASPHLGGLRKFQLSDSRIRQNMNVEARPLTSKVAWAIASATSLTGLESLTLSSVQIRSAGVVELCRQERFTSLRELHLAGTGLTKRGVKALCDAPHLGKLALLDVTRNRLSLDDIAQLNDRFPSGVVKADQLTPKSQAR